MPNHTRNYVTSFLLLSGLATLSMGCLLRPINTDNRLIQPDKVLLSGKEAFLHESASHPQDNRANVILLVADDLGKYDISLYGGENIPTPHIDALAASGVTFTDGYVTSPICSPSRAGFVTGRYQQRFGHELQPGFRYPKNRLQYIVSKRFIMTGEWQLNDAKTYPSSASMDTQGLPQSEITIGDLAKSQAYATGIIGKWHLGHSKGFTPLERGFDYHYGFYQAFSLYAPTDAPNLVNHRHKDITDRFIWDNGRVGPAVVRRNTTILDEKGYLTERFADEAEAFIERNKESPFLLYVPFNAPHTPFQAPKVYCDRFAHVEDENKRVYYGMISALDDAVGRIVQKVHDSGLEDKTLIVFVSDNGGAAYTQATTNAPFKGGKMTQFEGGVNVPFVLSWKGKIAPGSRYSHPVSTLDVFTTAAAAMHASLPRDRVYDGVDLVEKVSKNEPAHAALYWRSGSAKAVRSGDWKLVISGLSNRVWLYNLAADRYERTDLSAEIPEKVAELRAALSTWEEELIAPLWPSPVRNAVRLGGEEYIFEI